MLKNAVLCSVLGCALIASTFVLDYVNGNRACRERLDERVTYAELNADIHKKFGGYTISELCEGYDPPSDFLGKKQIEMEIINQYPELPVGCEITCAAAMLNFLGFPSDKCRLTDEFLPVSDGEFTEKNGILYGASPYKFFIGDPYGKGYGCYESVIANVLNDYFSKNASENKAVILKDANQADLERLIDGGAPVIVWASIDMKPYKYNAVSEWSTEDGEIIMWLSNSHTLILTGYDSSYYYFMDCNNKNEIQRYTKEAFIGRWHENGSRTIAVKLN